LRTRILCVHIETSSLWAEFINKNRCISVRLVLRRLKAFNFNNFDNSHYSFLWPEYFIDFLCERWIPCQASTSVLCLHYRPKTVYCSTKNAYTSEITFLALVPWYTPLSIIYLHAVQIYQHFWLSPYCKTNIFGKMFAKCVKVFICLTFARFY